MLEQALVQNSMIERTGQAPHDRTCTGQNTCVTVDFLDIALHFLKPPALHQDHIRYILPGLPITLIPVRGIHGHLYSN